MLDKIKTPEQLFDFLVKNMTYGIVDKNGTKWVDCTTEEMNQANMNWQMRSAEQIIKDGVGHCYDYTEVERAWFKSRGYEFKTFWYCAYPKGHPENGGPTHACLVYFDNGKWNHFEVSDHTNQGIHPFRSLQQFKKVATKRQIEYAKSQSDGEYDIIFKELKTPKQGISFYEYVHEVAPEF